MKILTVIAIFLIALNLGAADILTEAEKSNYNRTTRYADVIDFVFAVQKTSPIIKVIPLFKSSEGRMVPMVVISREGISTPSQMRIINKTPVLIQANIHAGEVEGKEASLMLIRDIAAGKIKGLLDNQIVLVIPILNADGNDKMSRQNRRDNGPDEAGIRANGQNLDLNRDALKLDSPELNALVRLYNTWDPVLMVDMHTTNGSYHREPVTYTTSSNPNAHQGMSAYMWDRLFPEVQKILKDEFNYDACPYGNYINRSDPTKGWRNHAFEARYCTNYIGLRNRFTILNENYSHADFKTRVLASFGFIQSVLKYSNRNINEMKELARKADLETTQSYSRETFAVKFDVEKLLDFTIKAYEFKRTKLSDEEKKKYGSRMGDYRVERSDKKRDYPLPYFAKAVPTETVPLPAGYILLPQQLRAAENLRDHGIVIHRVLEEKKIQVERFNLTKIIPARRLYQGNIAIALEGEYVAEESTIPEGSFYLELDQPLGRLIPILLQPESVDSLASWGFFNKVLVPQWGSRSGTYPVLRIKEKNPGFKSIRF